MLIASTRFDAIRPNAFSPDGRKIVFESTRSGVQGIWIANADGSSPSFLYGGTGYLSGSPVWSPEGKSIAFDSRKERHAQIYVISADGGAPRRITEGSFDDMVPAWSHDGTWIYFSSMRGERAEIYKVAPMGGTAIQVTHAGGWAPQESPDGRFLFYTRLRNGFSPLIRMPVGGGTEVQILPAVPPRGWTVGERGIWFFQPASDGNELRFFRFSSKQTRNIAELTNVFTSGLALSPDQRTVLYNRVDNQGTEILLVENFR
jgi:Tol biopolymer transport system component